jgi:uncharacterized protein YigE (DUF2233 family)
VDKTGNDQKAKSFSAHLAQRPDTPVRVKRTLMFCLMVLVLPSRTSAVDFSETQIAGKRVTICRVDIRKERLQLFLRDDTGQPFKRFERLAAWLQPRGQKLAFAMNAGMYQPDFSPLGLFVSDGRQITPLNTTNGPGNFFLKPNGVLVVTKTGARIVESSEYPKLREPIILATQSGPLLLRSGKIHPAFKADSENRFVRNGVGLSSPDVAVFAISEAPVTFYEFALMFRERLGCSDALFFDGAISSLYSPHLKRSEQRGDLGPIIAITE